MAFKRKKPAKTKAKPKTKPNKQRFSFFKNEKFWFIIGILFLSISAYLLISFVSFLFYGAADQSIMDSSWKEFLFNSDINVKNNGMKVGALLSEVIINGGFGLASFIFIYMLALTGLKILGRKINRYSQTLVYSLVLIVWISLALGLIFNKTNGESFIYLGGHYGFMLSNWLRSLIGLFGLILFLVITGVMIIVIRFDKAFDFLKGLFKSKEKESSGLGTSDDDDLDPFEEELEDDNLLGEDDISTIIDEDDVVRAIFEPDGDDDFEIEPEEEGEEEQEKKTSEEPEAEVKLDIDRGVEEEENDEFQNEEMEEYDPTLDLSDCRLICWRTINLAMLK